ncbi:hypothetical protein NVP1131O_09 [Vibrio phage 1.131.O._10N.222.49.A8]|nr:hypothetical protein NVP1131O_09 [Vibrio phage 1.131.O._10N.222.49.A8]
MSIRNELLEQIAGATFDIRNNASLAVAYTEIGSFGSASLQQPTGLGATGKIQVSFGAGGNTSGNEFQIDPDGTINTLSNGIQYTFDITIRPARTGASGVSVIMARFMYSADGTRTDSVQLGSTFSVEIDNAKTIWRESFTGTFSPAIGSELWLEIARDEGGDNSGDLRAEQPSGTLLADTPPWGDVNTARLTISKLLVVPE